MDPTTAQKLTDALAKDRLPGIEVIIAGIDLRFGSPCPSIYHIADGYSVCADQVAFAAIGTGARHAESQFMLAKYAGSIPNGEALLLAYSAKRDAEVAPGVGKETDVFVIGANVGQAFDLPPALKTKLEAEYRKMKARDQRAREKGRGEVKRWLDKTSSPSQPQQAPPTTIATTSSDEV